MSKEDGKEELYPLFYIINQPLRRNATKGLCNIWRETTKCTDTHLDLIKLANVRRYIIKYNRLTETEKDRIKKQVIADIQRNERVGV